MKLIHCLIIIFGASLALAKDLQKETVEAVLASLQCEQKDIAKILAPIRNLDKLEDELDDVGIDVEKEGEETDERLSLSFAIPLKLDGATTSKVELAIDGGEFVFFGEFTGDQAKLIKKMGLKQSDPDAKKDFVKPKPNGECEPTKRLRKIDETHFRFGCGWCQG